MFIYNTALRDIIFNINTHSTYLCYMSKNKNVELKSKEYDKKMAIPREGSVKL